MALNQKNDIVIRKPAGTLVRMWEPIDRFLFSPKDPTLLGLIRILCGCVTLYTALAYSFTLDEYLGKHAWWSRADRLKEVRDRPVFTEPLRGTHNPPRPPRTDEEQRYWDHYTKLWAFKPPPPYPKANPQAEVVTVRNLTFDLRTIQGQVNLADHYRDVYSVDFRTNGLAFPTTQKEMDYLDLFSQRYSRPPSSYPESIHGKAEVFQQEVAEIFKSMDKYGVEPEHVYARGGTEWSVWFHISDQWMVPVHVAICVVTFLFTIGFWTRMTAVFTWLGQMSYIHRAPNSLFGVDTMMVILLLYLMIAPCGAALSVDRVLGRWWSRRRKSIIARWKSFWSRARVSPNQIADGKPFDEKVQPSVTAGFALRLIQIHVCIIYFAAGISKLQGQAWWNGNAVWGTLANWEFAPMQHDIYFHFLWFIGSTAWIYQLFMTSAGYFTLFFEIGYPFLIWNRYTRWVILAMAIVLHGFIGLFMGLKTFSLMMLFMNMAFLRPSEVHWMLGIFRGSTKKKSGDPKKTRRTKQKMVMDKDKTATGKPPVETAGHIKRKK